MFGPRDLSRRSAPGLTTQQKALREAIRLHDWLEAERASVVMRFDAPLAILDALAGLTFFMDGHAADFIRRQTLSTQSAYTVAKSAAREPVRHIVDATRSACGLNLRESHMHEHIKTTLLTCSRTILATPIDGAEYRFNDPEETVSRIRRASRDAAVKYASESLKRQKSILLSNLDVPTRMKFRETDYRQMAEILFGWTISDQEEIRATLRSYAWDHGKLPR
jgi:hypothetical protein